MKEEAQRIAIAEALEIDDAKWMCQNDYAPDYLNDLNAMNEAEKVLTGDQRFTFLDELCKCSLNVDLKGADMITDDVASEIVSATAAQRAEAFLRTIGKWQDS